MIFDTITKLINGNSTNLLDDIVTGAVEVVSNIANTPNVWSNNPMGKYTSDILGLTSMINTFEKDHKPQQHVVQPSQPIIVYTQQSNDDSFYYKDRGATNYQYRNNNDIVTRAEFIKKMDEEIVRRNNKLNNDIELKKVVHFDNDHNKITKNINIDIKINTDNLSEEYLDKLTQFVKTVNEYNA